MLAWADRLGQGQPLMSYIWRCYLKYILVIVADGTTTMVPTSIPDKLDDSSILAPILAGTVATLVLIGAALTALSVCVSYSTMLL